MNHPQRVYISRDTSSRSLGADQLAHQLIKLTQDRTTAIDLVRTGSRGMFWLEPMIEVETPQGRVAYGPVERDDLGTLLDAGLLTGNPDCPGYLGAPQELPFLAQQQRLTFARVGITDPVSLTDYETHGGWLGLKQALRLTPQAIIDVIMTSGLRGRGGAAFPTAIKWQTVLDADSGKEQKYIVCNADEGDSGTFADRMLMEGDPLCLIEGMIIAGLAVGANRGYIYLREEYPNAHTILNEAMNAALDAGVLGDNILNSGHAFHLEVRLGAGAYICGEETALLESLEGKRGMVRAKPPLPAIVGLFGQPTVVNNVLSLASVPYILSHGGEHYRDYGTGRSRGTLAFQLSGNLKRCGLVELAFGATLHTLLYNFGGGCRSESTLRAVQVGGPLGAYLPEEQWHTPLDYEAFADIQAVLGHGGIVAFGADVDMSQQARFSMDFCVVESCGKCTPCRIGSTRGVEVIDKIRGSSSGDSRAQNITLLHDLCDTMEHGSLCAMGGMTPFPVRSALQFFSEDFTSTSATGATHD